MTEQSEIFRDDQKRILRNMIDVAHAGTDPFLQGPDGKKAIALSLSYAQSLSKHFRAAAKEAGDDSVFSALPQVPPLKDQIALDRKQFPAIDAEGVEAAQKLLAESKKLARMFLKAALKEVGGRDVDQLVLIEHARLHLSAAAVYHDRIEQAASNPRKGMMP